MITFHFAILYVGIREVGLLVLPISPKTPLLIPITGSVRKSRHLSAIRKCSVNIGNHLIIAPTLNCKPYDGSLSRYVVFGFT